MPVYIECPVEGCRRPAASRSRWCERHKQRNVRYGSPTGSAMSTRGKRNMFEVETKVARRYLTIHHEHPAVAGALQLAEQLMDYRAETATSADLRLEQAFKYQRDAGATPLAVVERVVAFYLYTDRKPFSTQKQEDCALGRLVLHVVALNNFRWPASVNAPAGQMARQLLGTFALALIRKVKADTDRMHAQIAASATL